MLRQFLAIAVAFALMPFWSKKKLGFGPMLLLTGLILLGVATYTWGVRKKGRFMQLYLALPVVLPIAAGGFLRIHGMTPALYLLPSVTGI